MKVHTASSYLAVVIFSLLLLTGCGQPGTSAQSPPTSTAEPPPMLREGPVKGFRAPDFTLNDLQTNRAVTLSALQGKPVFLNFWATWCPPCRKEMPEIENVYAKYKGQVEFIGISSSASDDLPKVKFYLDAAKFSWTFLDDSDDAVSTKYEAMAYPTSYFIDENGVISTINIGPMSQAELEKNLQAMTHVKAKP